LPHHAFDVVIPRTSQETTVYQKPTLMRFGSFRELTQLGNDGASDGASFQGISSPGCSTDGVPQDCPPTAS
jgi:hypothetical protein